MYIHDVKYYVTCRPILHNKILKMHTTSFITAEANKTMKIVKFDEGDIKKDKKDAGDDDNDSNDP